MEQEQVEFTTKLNLLDAVLEIEHTGKYRIFRDDAFGKKDAQHWLEDNAIHSDTNDEVITDIIYQEGAEFVLDRMLPTDVVNYVADNYRFRVIDKLINHHNLKIFDDIMLSMDEFLREIDNDCVKRKKFVENVIHAFGHDAVLGPIDSRMIVIHLENTTDYFCIDLGNECNDYIVNTMYQYFKKENTLIKFMEIMVDDICKQSQDVQNG